MLGVQIQGAENLQFGDNTVNITVTAEDNNTVKVYTIHVHRKTKEEEDVERKASEALDRLGKEKKENNWYWWFIGVIVLILVIAIALILWKRKNKDSSI